MDKVPPPTHLSDLRIVPLMETHGRERRWRYFTFASYREIIANEKLDDQDGPYSSVDFSNVGNFAPFVAEDFYSDVVELNHLMDYAFSKTGKMATPATGKKRKRGEAGLDTLADHAPRKRGRPRKHPVEGVAGEGAATRRVRGQSSAEGCLGSTQPEGTVISNDLHSSSPKVPRKRRRQPDDNHVSEFVPEAPVAPKRRGRPRKRPLSRPPTDETGHTPLQNVINSSDVHTAHHPISEPLPPNVNVREAEARSTLNENDTALQYSELLIQPDLTSTIYDYRSVGDLGMGMGVVDDDQLRLAQPDNPDTDPKPTGRRGPRELDVEGDTLIQMDICSEPSVSTDAPSGARSQVYEMGHRV